MEDLLTSIETRHQTIPLGKGAGLSEQEKMQRIAFYFSEIMQTLGMDLSDDSLCGTPDRVAKMYVTEMFKGLNADNMPMLTLFENKAGYRGMLLEKDITFYSCCEHHFVPIIGRAHVAYLPDDQIIGLSKINRLVQYVAARPQVQERLTMDIAAAMKNTLGHENVAVYLEADHLCVAGRGIRDTNSTTITSCYSGRFQRENWKQEFLNGIAGKK